MLKTDTADMTAGEIVLAGLRGNMVTEKAEASEGTTMATKTKIVMKATEEATKEAETEVKATEDVAKGTKVKAVVKVTGQAAQTATIRAEAATKITEAETAGRISPTCNRQYRK